MGAMRRGLSRRDFARVAIGAAGLALGGPAGAGDAAALSLAFTSRKPGLSRGDFRLHFESRHAPLFAALAAPVLQRYVRNHVVGTLDPGFDCLTEFHFRPGGPEGLGALMASPDGHAVHEDGLAFISGSRLMAAQARLIAGPPLLFEPGPVRRHLVLLARRPDLSPDDFAAAAAA
jgi:hypothetical protein